MRRLLLILAAIVGVAITAAAQTPDTVTLKAGQQRSGVHSRLKIKFIAVTEDSRCPMGANCIWAGNAKVKFEVIGRTGGRKTFEANTTTGPKGDQFDGWAIDLVSLTPSPKMGSTLNPRSYQARFTITRLQR
jgi:hypothetical protein